jgi:formate hydrogenlyase subunit 6/NADH:ubiquinone oxidoreductase subunit I
MKEYFNNIYQAVSSISIGLAITFKQMFHKSVTIQYPEQRLQLPERERNRLFVNMEDCIGCDQCAKACPVSCIDIETVKVIPGDVVGKTGVTSQGKKKALHVTDFTIDFAKCCYCQLCVFPCPTECIYMTDVFEFSTFNRDLLKYQFADLTPSQGAEKKETYAKYALEQEEKKKQAAIEAAAKKAAEEKAKAEENPAEKPAEEKKETDSKTDNKDS